MKSAWFFLFFLLAITGHGLEVASLHPLITDAVRQVGGERVTVVELVKPGDNVHQFKPSPDDIRKLSKATLVFASGMDLEPYLDKLGDSMGSHQTMVEVGDTIPFQKVSAEDQIYSCCKHHAAGGIDPHWWHNVKNMERAIRVIEKALRKADPEGKSVYSANSKEARQSLKELDRWVKSQVATIPRDKRHLVTAHAAFGYFCRAYGFKASFVQGLSARGELSASQLAGAIKQLRSEAIPTVFPEQSANPKVLRQIAKETGATVGQPLIADGSAKTYRDMMVTNVEHIVAGLK
jgi:zinc/manganese transport system substrate-binding protein